MKTFKASIWLDGRQMNVTVTAANYFDAKRMVESQYPKYRFGSLS